MEYIKSLEAVLVDYSQHKLKVLKTVSKLYLDRKKGSNRQKDYSKDAQFIGSAPAKE